MKLVAFCTLAIVSVNTACVVAIAKKPENLNKQLMFMVNTEDSKNPVYSLESQAYKKPRKGEPESTAKAAYLKKLSPGGRIFFLANRLDFQEALNGLNSFPKRDSASALYVKAFCLTGLNKPVEAVQAFKAAERKIDNFFNPGAKFYLQYATAHYFSGNYSDALKYLALAEEKSKSKKGGAKEHAFQTIAYSVPKRRGMIKEKQGQYKEAFDEYLTYFPKKNRQFHLSEPIVANAEIAGRAKKWLSENPAAPNGDATKQAKFYLTQGKAYLAVADMERATESLKKAANNQEIDISLNTLIGIRSFSAVRDDANTLLVRIFYLQKNLKESCAAIRAIFIKDPAEEFKTQFVSLAMRDVAQIIGQSDFEAHDAQLESKLDTMASSRLEFSGRGTTVETIDTVDEKLLKSAQLDMQSKNYKSAYSMLKEFHRSNADSETTVGHKTLIVRHIAYREKYDRKVQMLKIAAGVAAGITALELDLNAGMNKSSFVHGIPVAFLERDLRSGGSTGPYEFWEAINDVLHGRDIQKRKDIKNLEKRAAFAPWCHFARGVKTMYEKDYKTAASEFNAIKDAASTDKDLSIYSRVLKEECEKRRRSQTSP